MSNTLLTENDIQKKVKECAQWIDNAVRHSNNYIICPILQSSYYFAADVSRHLITTPDLDFFGIQRYVEDYPEDLYIYKAADLSLVNNKTAVVVDVLVSSGTTVSTASKMLQQAGASEVLVVTLLCRQSSQKKPDWVGTLISDEQLYGYGMDLRGKHRTLSNINYE